ncbi:hypothetical protein [Enterobacter cloacae complex sp. ESBL7]|uniref:hypothetical protein n=1 Tax=Enterobacter cloacae complex sp. ESBL7 TaxID=3163325 RepID=UPI003568FEFC
MSFIRSNTLKLSAMAAATGIALMSTAVYAADPVSADPFTAHINIESSSTCGIEVTPPSVNSFQAVLDVNVASGTTHYTTMPPKNQPGMLTIVKAIGGASCDLNSGLSVVSRPTNTVSASNASVSNMALGSGVIPATIQPSQLLFKTAAGVAIPSNEWTYTLPGATNPNGAALMTTPVELTGVGSNGGPGTNYPYALVGTCGTAVGNIACFGTTTTYIGPNIAARGTDKRRTASDGTLSYLFVPVSPESAAKAAEVSIGFVGTIGAYPTDLNGIKDLSLVHDGSSGKLDVTVDITLV